MGEATLRPGDRVERLIVLEEIGRGAKGVVFKAYDPRLDRNVALKIIQGGSSDSEDVARKRLVKEAQAMAKLSDPNVVTVHHVGTVKVEGRVLVYLEMEYVRGRSLEAQMQMWRQDEAWQRGAAWRDVVRLFAQAGAGLAAAHELGLVHRDFKPANVLVDEAGRARVTDFGLVRRSGEVMEKDAPARGQKTPALDVPLTQTGAVVGTPAYMAPEQFEGLDGDASVDQFAFCVALFEALHGVRPFPGDTFASLMHAVLEDGPRAPPDGAPRVPGFVDRVMRRGLSKDPAQRFSDMRALLEALAHDPGVARRRGVAVVGGVAGLGAIAYGVSRWLEPGLLALSVVGSGGSVEGLEIEIDGAAVPAEQTATHELAAGLHRVHVEADHHEPYDHTFELARGETLRLVAPLQHETGTIDLDVHPQGARLRIDGAEFGSILERLAVDTGEHALHVAVPGAHETRLSFTVAKGEHLELTAYADPAVVFEERGGGLPLGRGALGDADGDGFGDVWNRDYGTLSAYSPMKQSVLWRRPLSRHSVAAFLQLWDLDGDGVRDPVVLGTDEEGAVLRVLGASNGKVRFEVVPDEGREPMPLVPPVLYDGPGGPLIVVTSLERAAVAAYDVAGGSQRWKGVIEGSGFGLVLGREPAGGWVAVAADTGVTVFDAASGERRFHRSVPGFTETLLQGLLEDNRLLLHGRDSAKTWLVAAELDERAGEDLVFPVLTDCDGGPLLALSGADGTELWQGPPVWVWSLRSVDDQDGDGYREVSAVRAASSEESSDPSVFIDGRTGEVQRSRTRPERSVRWPCDGPMRVIRPRGGEAAVTAPDSTEPVLRLGFDDEVSIALCSDWDGDGADDLVIGTDHSGLRAYGADGEIGAVALARRIDFLDPLGDINGDARPDFLVGGGGVRVVLGSRVIWGRGFRAPLWSAPVVDDFDGDGSVDVALFDGQQESSHLEMLSAVDGRRLARAPEGGFALRPPTPVPGLHPGTVDLVYLGSPRRVSRVLGRDFSVHTLPIGDDDVESYARVGASGDGRRLWITSFTEAPHLRGIQAAAEDWVPGAGVTRDDPWSLDFAIDGVFGGWTQPVAVGLDDDPSLEVVASIDRARVVVVDAESGECAWSRWAGTKRLNRGPALVDLDDDGRPEVLHPGAADAPDLAPSCDAAAEAGPPAAAPDLLALDGGSGALRWRLAEGGASNTPVVLVSSGAGPLLVGASASRGLFALERGGTIRWQSDDVGPVSSPIATGDLDGDGRPEVVVGTTRGELVVVDPETGRVHWRWRAPRREAQTTPPVLADADGDGRSEIFVARPVGTLFVLDGSFTREGERSPPPVSERGSDDSAAPQASQ